MKNTLKIWEMDVYSSVPTIRVKAKNKTEARKLLRAKLRKMKASSIVDFKESHVELSWKNN